MTKDTYIDGAHIIVCGGVITDENSVWRDDLEALLPAAINYVLIGGYWEQIKAEGDREIPGVFVGEYNDVPVLKDDRGSYAILPALTVALPSDRAIRMVLSNKCDQRFHRMNDSWYTNWHYYKNIYPDERMYYVVGQQLRLFGLNGLESVITIRQLNSTEAYAGSDHLPVPVGREIEVVNQLVKLFSAQRTIKADRVEDQADVN